MLRCAAARCALPRTLSQCRVLLRMAHDSARLGPAMLQAPPCEGDGGEQKAGNFACNFGGASSAKATRVEFHPLAHPLPTDDTLAARLLTLAAPLLTLHQHQFSPLDTLPRRTRPSQLPFSPLHQHQFSRSHQLSPSDQLLTVRPASHRIKAKYGYGVLIFMLTFSLVSVSGYREEKLFKLERERVSTVAVGGCLCLIVSIVICPVWAGGDLHNSIVKNYTC
ncbi:hypothetical protein EJ110_NYTH15815 [Nymphaea thermarum]|nr:hypothetical protein EJ110_NYTH15815 [Nymphaea thermarum]